MSNSKLKLECSEANHICDKNQYREASLWEKIKLSFHLIYCRACQNYTKKNNALTKLSKSSRVETMNVAQKDSLKDRLAKELAKQNQGE